MLGFLFETVGRAGKGLVDLADAGIDEVVSIPDRMSKGYNEGFTFSNEDKPEERKSPDTKPRTEGFPPTGSVK